ncbi:MAG: ornithine carbamoyltransferase [Candidatus Dadabacteria bacterium]|nr:ornithine carbamoyltransferase [Candidatus Dadabacteria bacterium]MDE0292209.1 ornithine carbamoyltransferase [Candidatus Dadabacteria bacterium]
MGRNLLAVSDLEKSEIREIIRRSGELKELKKQGESPRSLAGMSVGLLFEKQSTRTRLSFEAGLFDLGAQGIYMNPADTQLGRGETIADTAKILSSYLDGIIIRTYGQEKALELAENSTVPVINALTDLEHPTQIISDLFSISEQGINPEKFKLAFLGDGNNIANSFVAASAIMGFDLSLAVPPGYEPNPAIMGEASEQGNSEIEVTHDPASAVRDADVIYTDVWVSMGEEGKGIEIFRPFQVNEKLLSSCRKKPLIMHCLPAHRGEEITAGVMDSSSCIAFTQAENKLHAGKAILEFCLLDYLAS